MFFRTNVGIEAAMSTVSKAAQEAVDNCKATAGRQMQAVKLSAAWIGMAGYDRQSLSSKVDESLSKLFGLPIGKGLKVTNDIDLLPILAAGQTDIGSLVVVVAGTGSIAMSYAKIDGQFRRTHRIGGWGHLLGDDGSGYGIGREAIRTALYSSDLYNIHAGINTAAINSPFPPLSQAVFQHFKKLYPGSRPENLLSTVLVPDPTVHQVENATLATSKRIASVAKVVISMADRDDEAKRIVESGVSSLVDLVAMLVQGGEIDPMKSGLLLAGGLMQNELYETKFSKALEARCGKFKYNDRVALPAVVGAQYLASHTI